ncbi:MAG: hypothetical protein GY845_17095 [Planctomycetes bacterium]|nr:hypothetical protein [Planctomycetota bacterium]
MKQASSSADKKSVLDLGITSQIGRFEHLELALKQHVNSSRLSIAPQVSILEDIDLPTIEGYNHLRDAGGAL